MRSASHQRWTPPNKRMQPTANSAALIIKGSARRLMRGVRFLSVNSREF